MNWRFLAAIAIAGILVLPPESYAKGRSSSGGSHAVRGYTTKRGTYVAPTRATNPNRTQRDNYSSKGNVNPATGKSGTRTPKR